MPPCKKLVYQSFRIRVPQSAFIVMTLGAKIITPSTTSISAILYCSEHQCLIGTCGGTTSLCSMFVDKVTSLDPTLHYFISKLGEKHYECSFLVNKWFNFFIKLTAYSKSNIFACETTIQRISIFEHLSMLYVIFY